MKPITEARQIEHCRTLLNEMMLAQERESCEFSPDWIRKRGWKVVPAESAARLPEHDIPRLVSVLNAAGYAECFVVATEDLGDMPKCYLVSIDAADIRELNRGLGLFRFLLTSEDRSWAISCNEWYNLFGASPELLEAMLGKPIGQARQEFFEFASVLAKGKADTPLLRIAKECASL